MDLPRLDVATDVVIDGMSLMLMNFGRAPSLALRLVLASYVTTLVGCTTAIEPSDAGSRTDAGRTGDAGRLEDAATSDSGPQDAGSSDAGPTDAGGILCGDERCFAPAQQCCPGCFGSGFCMPAGEECPEVVGCEDAGASDAGPPPDGGETCGETVCVHPQVCCNPILSQCVLPDEVCAF